jgi:hypothetical protein
MGSQKDVAQSFPHNIVGNFVQDSYTIITSRDVTSVLLECESSVPFSQHNKL